MAITKLNLTGGNAPFDPADPRTFPTGFSTFEDSVDTELASLQSQIDAGVFSTSAGLTIVEVTAGVWSGDAPAGRNNGANPIWFIPLDPANPTNPSDPIDGIATPANIRAWDRVGPVLVDAL